MRRVITILFALVICIHFVGCNAITHYSNQVNFDTSIVVPAQCDYKMETRDLQELGTLRTFADGSYVKVYTRYSNDLNEARIFIYSATDRDFYQEVDLDSGVISTQDNLIQGKPLEYYVDLNQIINEETSSGNRIVYAENATYTISQNHIIEYDTIKNDACFNYYYYNFKEHFEPLNLKGFEVPEDILERINEK